MATIVIADTSCLILYETIGRFDILQHTFENFVVTTEVAKEYGSIPEWISIQAINNKATYLELRSHLGKGEASSIVLALENENSVLILDEKKGRRIALEYGIEIIGSLGLLLKAKEKGVIDSVREILVLIEQTKFRISQQIKQKILQEAGE